MEPDGPQPSPASIGRIAFGIATVVTALLGFTGDHRWLAASGAFGTIWWFWDLVWANVLSPLGGFFEAMLTGAATVSGPPELTLDDTIRLLEARVRDEGVAPHIRIQSAVRLAEMYRYGRKDPAKADSVLGFIRARYPDAPELERLGQDEARP